MTATDSANKDISAAKTKRGNKGANKGKRYSRMSASYDKGRIFGEILHALLIATDIPEYRSKKSNHVYSQWQKIAILIFMAYEDIPMYSLRSELGKYRGFVESMGLRTIPDGSTMCKFLKTLESGMLERAFLPFQSLIPGDIISALDSTGLSNFDRSAHYEFRCDNFGKKLPHRTFTKLSFVVDTGTRFILSARASVGNKHDVCFASEHIDDLIGCKDRIRFFLADKGYDSTSLLDELALRIKCEVRIPVKVSEKNGFSVHGIRRRNMFQLMQDKAVWKTYYGKRSIIESTNFMLKNLTTSKIHAIIDSSREKCALLKALAFNIHNSIRVGADWILRV